jgi:hypothetical protein
MLDGNLATIILDFNEEVLFHIRFIRKLFTSSHFGAAAQRYVYLSDVSVKEFHMGLSVLVLFILRCEKIKFLLCDIFPVI